jgi:acetolactate synthase-1/2/3 large subunit
MRIYQALADAFFSEGVEASFTLMGDGNMHFATALSEKPGMRTYMVRHEHAALAAATAYGRASGKIAVASVTCGPGLTQLSTALASAVYAKIPVVVFAGESPIDKSWYGQRIEQAPIVTATGAHYIHAHSLPRMQEYVRDAFFIARTERRPVVIGVPYDKQLEPFPSSAPYLPSTQYLPRLQPLLPHPDELRTALDAIAGARRIALIGGRGVQLAGAEQLCRQFAERVDGLLSTTLLARGLFDDDPLSLGIAGGYSSAAARDEFKKADLVVAVGASLNYHTMDGGNLFPNATVLQIDTDPVGMRDALKTADLYLRADAKAAMQALLDGLADQPPRPVEWRSDQLAERLRTEAPDPFEFQRDDTFMDPRDAVAALDETLPKDWILVNGTGHSAAFSAHMRGRRPENFLTIREFGAIGNGICYAIGMAAAHPDRTIAVIDGDGSVLMHIQELETIRRHGLRILICALNDGAYGPEIHKLRHDGIDDFGSVFGRGDLGKVARGFGLDGTIVTDPSQLDGALAAFQSGSGAAIWDLHVSDQVVSPMMRRAVAKRERLA